MTDIGARYRGYVADGGRGFTYGPANEEKRAIVAAAARAVEAGLAAARQGTLACDLNTVIQRSIVASGYEAYSSEARGHGTGHGTGMDPEEEQPMIHPANRTVLLENMVFTLKATITVPDVGGLRTERIVRLSRERASRRWTSFLWRTIGDSAAVARRAAPHRRAGIRAPGGTGDVVAPPRAPRRMQRRRNPIPRGVKE